MRSRPGGLPERWAVVVAIVVAMVSSGLTALPTAPHSPRPGSALPSVPATRRASTAPGHSLRPISNSISAAVDPSFSNSSAGVVTRTIFPGFNTSLPGSFTSSVATWQVGTPTYVPSTNTLWFPQRSVAVPGDPWPTVAPAAVFNLTTGGFDQLVTNLSNASALAYNPGNGDIYATIPGEDSIVAVNPRNGTAVVPPITVGSEPDALAFDANTNQLFVANNLSSNVTVINTLSNKVTIQSIPVGNNPVALQDDAQDGLLFVANSNSNFLTVLNTSNPASSPAKISLYDGDPDGLAFSPKSDRLIVTTPANQNATIIVAKAETPLNAELSVGTGVVPCALSANGTEFVLANRSGSDVLVLNAVTGNPVGATLSTERNVTELAVDQRSGIVYLWTSSNRTLESLNLSVGGVAPVGTTVFPQLNSESESPRSPRILAGATNQSLILSLNPTSLQQTSPAVESSAAPLSVAMESSANRYFVGTTSGIEIYNTTTDAPEGTVSGLTGACNQLVLDPSENLLWLSNTLLGVVAVNLTTLHIAIFTSLTIPSTSTDGIAVDVQDSETFVLVSPNRIDVLNSHTGTVVPPGIAVGNNVTSLVLDPADDQLYAAGDVVSLVSPTSLVVDGEVAPFGGIHQVLGAAYDSSRRAVYVASIGEQSGLQGVVTEIDGTSVAASSESWVQAPVGEDPAAIGVVQWSQGSPVGLGMVWVANEQSGTISVISTPPQVTFFRAVPATLDLGEATSFEVAVSGGGGQISDVFAPLPPGCQTADVDDLNCTPTATGNFAVNVTVTDSLGVSATATTTVSVLQALSVRTTYSTVTFPVIDAGIALTGSAQAQNGLPPYAFEWNFGDGFTASGAGASHVYLSPGIYIVNAQARDATGATANSSTLVTVVPRPAASIAASPGLATDVDLPISLFGNVSGGVGGNGGNWSFGDGSNASGAVATHAWTSVGTYNVTFRFVDALGVPANASISVLVNPPLAATFSSGIFSASNPAIPGASIPFTALVSGGTPPYNVLWSFGDGSNASGPSHQHAYAAVGMYTVSVALRDAVGATLRSNLTVEVSPPPSSAEGITSLGGGFGTGLFLGLVLGGVVAAVILFASGPRRRPPPPPPPPTPYVPP